MRKTYAISAIVLFVVAALVAAVALTWGGNRIGADGSDPAGDTNPAVSQQVIDLLTVNQATIKCTDIVGAANVADAGDGRMVVKPSIGALQNVPPRLWSDALSTPLNPHSLRAVQVAVCEDPLLGVTYANMLSTLKVGGTSVLGLNPWLKPFAGSPANINNIASLYVPQLNGGSINDAAIAANQSWQAEAEFIGTLLGRFNVEGVKALPSKVNYHLTGGGLAVGGLPEVGLDRLQDKKSALILSVTEKNNPACILKIGFNLGDKRPEVFGCPAPPKKTHTPTSTPTPTNTPTSTPTPTNTPTPCVKPPKPGDGPYVYDSKTCTWHKPAQSDDCMLNGGSTCAPNNATQDPQDNDTSGVNTGGTSGAPTTAPSPVPTGPAPGPTPSNSPETDPTATPTGYATGMPG